MHMRAEGIRSDNVHCTKITFLAKSSGMDYLYTNDVIVIGLKLLGRGKNYDWKTQLSVAF